MKVTKKILLICLAITVMLSTSLPVFALPGNTVVIGNKAFSLDYFFDSPLNSDISKAIVGGGDIYLDIGKNGDSFKDAFTGKAITDAQKTGLTNIEYLNYDGTKATYSKFDDKTPTQAAITIKSITAVNATTIEVTFSDNVKKTYTDQSLKDGDNQVTVVYNGATLTGTVKYTPQVVAAKGVEKVELVNYRYLKVTFNGLVDKESAANANNYYFEIVDGNAAYKAAPSPTLPSLQESNQLSKIETAYGAIAWWNGEKDAKGNYTKPPHIVAADVDGKTVVSIYLPEDARFTNETDAISGDYPNPFSAHDMERTLSVRLKDSKWPNVYTVKELVKETVVNIAVRNVKDTDGKLSIDTKVVPVTILDNTSPELVGVNVIKNDDSRVIVIKPGSDLGSFDLLRNNGTLKQTGEQIELVYNEPVYDSHKKEPMSDLDWFRDVTLYVNNKPIASLSRHNLDQFMKFEMGNSTYEASKKVKIDVEAAVRAAINQNPAIDGMIATGVDYTIQFVGVTDLAGNIEVVSDHSFTVRFHDDAVVPPTITIPNVLGVDQVADNIFRVEFNREKAEGNFVIENPDGEGRGIFFETRVVPSAKSANGKFYSYVAVPALDDEDIGLSFPSTITKDQLLAYDGDEQIARKIRVEDVIVAQGNDPVAKDVLHGVDFLKTMTLIDDVKSPVVTGAEDVAYKEGNTGTILNVNVKDVTPWVDDENIKYWYSPIAYVYNGVTESFENRILADQSIKTYLPVKVSYVDAAGKTHQALVSNRTLDPDNGTTNDKNPGRDGNIDFKDGKLVLNLADYSQLLASNGQLVPGATYTISIPDAYFTDSPLDINFNPADVDFSFGGANYDILYVDSGRDGDKYTWSRPLWWLPGSPVKIESGMGYFSKSADVTCKIGTKPDEKPADTYVPQTSKQLITYDPALDLMRIEFTGTIDDKTLIDKNNYSINGKTLTQWDAELGTNTLITHEDKNGHQYAVFAIPQNSIQVEGDYELIVKGVSHPNGATMETVRTEVRLEDNYRPVVVNAEQTTLQQIKLTFNEPIKYYVDPAPADIYSTAKNFIVKVGGTAVAVETAVLPVGLDNNREIILNCGPIDANGNITVEVVEDGNGNILVIDKSQNKNKMKLATYDVVRLVQLPKPN